MKKDTVVIARLTQRQHFMLSEISKEAGISKSALVRYALDRLIDKYDA